MGFTVTKGSGKEPQGNSDQRQKNRVREHFETPNELRLENRRHPLKTQQEKPTYTYKIASGRPFWPSRYPIEEQGGLNLHEFVYNTPTSWVDRLGWDSYDLNTKQGDFTFFETGTESRSTCIIVVARFFDDRTFWQEALEVEAEE